MSLWKKVLIGLAIGILLGLMLQEKVIYLKPFGDIFIRMIKMIIVPLIFFAIVTGITSIQDTKVLGRIGLKASIAYFITTLFAITIGLSIGTIFNPGEGVILHFDTQTIDQKNEDNLVKVLDVLLNIVPDNALGAMAQGSIIQVVFFALFTGITVNSMDSAPAKRLIDIFQLLSSMIFKMVNFILTLSPLAACCLTAWIIGTQGLDVLKNLLKLIGCAYLAFGIQYCLFGIMIYLWRGLSPTPFFKKSLEYQTIAFATSSSKSALPTTIKVCQQKLGVSKTSSSFVLPLGASINMDGIAIYVSLCALFFAQVTGKLLSFSDYGFIILTSTLGSIGGAGIPGGTIVMLPMVLGSVGLPIEGIALIAGIDRIVDMMRTTISITGDAAVTVCIDDSEGLMDRSIYEK
jgi:Na+/H+-dicarboxylate symporter